LKKNGVSVQVQGRCENTALTKSTGKEYTPLINQ
jgi:hypothetical protein